MNPHRHGSAARLLAGAVVAASACGIATSQTSEAGPLGKALGETKPIFDARIRYEYVDQDPLLEEADADTLRLRLGFQTGAAWNTRLLAEGEFVWPFGGDYRGDNALPSHATHPVVADPESYELNRLQLTNTSLPGTTITLGRQRILLDDQRFVGNVGWRQNEQTFDALRVVNQSVDRLTIDVTYLNQVNRVFGPDSPQGRYQGDGYLGNLGYQTPLGKLTGFAYLLDFDPIPATRLPAAMNPVRSSTATYGLRLAGARTLHAFELGYVASYAMQEDYGRNPLALDLDYSLLELTGTWRGVSLSLGREALEGNGTVGFATPLATLHKFNGWADKFLVTPPNGIDDRYASVGYARKSWGVLDSFSASIACHRYESERGSLDLGTEIDLQLQAKWQRLLATVKYADYQLEPAAATAAYRDTVKYWLMLDYVW